MPTINNTIPTTAHLATRRQTLFVAIGDITPDPRKPHLRRFPKSLRTDKLFAISLSVQKLIPWAQRQNVTRLHCPATVGHRPKRPTPHPWSTLKGPAPRARTKRATPASPISFQRGINWAQRVMSSPVRTSRDGRSPRQRLMSTRSKAKSAKAED